MIGIDGPGFINGLGFTAVGLLGLVALVFWLIGRVRGKSTPPHPAGWWPDPAVQHQLQYWDGAPTDRATEGFVIPRGKQCLVSVTR